jgi:hypothetical protein
VSQAANRLNFTRMRAVVKPEPAAADESELYVAKVVATTVPGTEILQTRLTDQGYDFTIWGFTITMGSTSIKIVTVSFFCRTPGATIRYNPSTTPPTPQSPLYTEPLVLDVPGRYYFSVQATKAGLRPSPVLRVQYDLTP